MNAKELRIGNYFEYRIQDEFDERKDWWELSKIDPNDLSILLSNDDEDYRPIQLTEEWLLKLGFTKKDNPNNTPSWIWKKNGEVWFFQTWKDMDIFIKNFLATNQKQINYVHQLQNLYFALTGEELTCASQQINKSTNKQINS